FTRLRDGGTTIDAASVAIEGRTRLADGNLVTNITSAPAVDAVGDVAFGVRRAAPASTGSLPRDLGPAILRRTQSGLGLVVARGEARQGLFLASPTRLAADLVVKLSGGRARDRVGLRGSLRLGRITNGVAPARDGVTITLGDASGRVLWSSNVPASALARHGNRFEPALDRQTLRRQLRTLRLRVGRGSVRVAAQSPALDLTEHGTRPPVAPLSLTVQIGDDSGTAIIPCRLGRRGG